MPCGKASSGLVFPRHHDRKTVVMFPSSPPRRGLLSNVELMQIAMLVLLCPEKQNLSAEESGAGVDGVV